MLAKIIEYTGFAIGITLITLAAWDYVAMYIEAIKLAITML